MATARVNVVELAVHAVRLLVALALLGLAASRPPLALAAAAALFVAAFAFNHDLMHGALGLPRRVNEALLSVVALVMGNSGHGMRMLHLRHHARPLAADDIEGLGATLSPWRALMLGATNAARYRLEGCAAAGRTAKLENAAALALTAAALLSRTAAGAAWAVMNVGMTLTMALWASHLPHRPPRWLVRLARRLAWTRSAAVLSFAFHAEHHAHPKVPCGALDHRPA
jgi:fatty acid desaturase